MINQKAIEFTIPKESLSPQGLGEGAPDQRVLDIAYVSQTCGNWCWATCGTMLARSIMKNNVKICQVASMIITNGNCCNGAPPEGQFNEDWDNAICNVTCTIDQVHELHGKLGMDSTHKGSSLSFDDLYQEIVVLGTPVQVAFFWYGGGGHVAIVHGVDKQTQSVNINDPWPDRGQITVPFLQLEAAYGSGSWGDSWTDLKPTVA